MNHINKFNTTEEFNQAKEELGKLEHYLVYDAEAKKISAKPIIPKTMKFIFTKEIIDFANSTFSEIGIPLIVRKDLFKSIKYNGKELLTEPTVNPFEFKSEDLITRFEELFETLSSKPDSYVITTKNLSIEPKENDEITLNVELKMI